MQRLNRLVNKTSARGAGVKKQEEKQFAKVYAELLNLGVLPRAAILYGKLEFMALEKGQCWPTHATLAKILRLKSRRHVLRLLDYLHALKLIEWTRSRYYCRYRVLPPDVTWIAHQMRHGCHILDVLPVSHRKEKSSSKKRSTEKTPSSPYPLPPNAQANASDDDGPNLTPEQRFLARLLARHGKDFDSNRCLANVRGQLEKRGLTIADFLPFDSQRTTGNNFTNPHGYYVHLAKEFVKQTIRDAQNAAFHAPKPAPDCERDEKGRCAKCGGHGTLEDGSFCDACPIGCDLTRLAKRKHSRTSSQTALP